ncbi:MAG: HAD family hydrolase, partial [Candidatus Eremiobacteraeota bacterium]|nr:HAD family hydrolase [Candidatus Eremiobacteraeota bacterium]
DIDEQTATRLKDREAAEYEKLALAVEPLPGAKELLQELTRLKVPWAIATSGSMSTAKPALTLLDIPTNVPIITRDDVDRAKPDPDLFLAAAKALGSDSTETMVVGDSVWDMLAARRAHFLGIGILAGGYAVEELQQSGAYRVYSDPGDMLAHLDEMGVRGEA